MRGAWRSGSYGSGGNEFEIKDMKKLRIELERSMKLAADRQEYESASDFKRCLSQLDYYLNSIKQGDADGMYLDDVHDNVPTCSKSFARMMLNSYLLTNELPIKDVVVTKQIVGSVVEERTFRGLLKRAYDLQDKPK